MTSNRFTVITVDDSKLIRENVRRLLIDLGIPDVLEAETGIRPLRLCFFTVRAL